MEFPKSQTGIARLADMMLKGYFLHSADFPSVYRVILLFEVKKFQNAVKAQSEAVSVLRQEAQKKNEKLKSLKTVMRQCLKKSIVDTKDNPQKLLFIGWGPKEDCRPQILPNQPVDLQVSIKDNAVLNLSWKKGGGRNKVRNYIIERRQQAKDSFSKWIIAANSYRTKITLTGQPKKVRLEYRVTAANSAGKSIPSNTVNIII